MKRHYVIAALIAVINISLYPLLRHLAYLERGYSAHGGELLLFMFGFVVTFMVLENGLCRKVSSNKKGRSRVRVRHRAADEQN